MPYLKYFFLTVILFSFIACGGSSGDGDGNTTFENKEDLSISGSNSISVDGSLRSYNFVIPDIQTYPLVIALHGGEDEVEDFEEYTDISSFVRDTNTFGVVYPVGINGHWNDGRDEADSGSGADDIAFIDALITQYRESGITEFYVVGMSNGGLMTQRVACELSHRINGIMVISATHSSDLSNNCLNTFSPVPALIMFGDDDRSFLDNGNIVNPLFPSSTNRGTHIGIDATLDYWLTRNQCNTLNVTESIDTDTNDNTEVVINDASNCTSPVRYYNILGGGHRWPDPSGSNDGLTTSILGYASHEISTAQEMIDFFSL